LQLDFHFISTIELNSSLTYIPGMQEIVPLSLNLHKIHWIISQTGNLLVLGSLHHDRPRGKRRKCRRKAGNCRDSQQRWNSPTSIECEGERNLHVPVLSVRAPAAASPLSWERTRVSRQVTVFVP